MFSLKIPYICDSITDFNNSKLTNMKNSPSQFILGLILMLFVPNISFAQIVASSADCPDINNLYIIGSNSVCNGESTTLKVSGEEVASYNWGSNRLTQEISITESGIYTVTVTCLSNILEQKVLSITVNNCCPDSDGGTIVGNEQKCGRYKPSTITSTALPTGGSGTLTYFWIKTTLLADVTNGTQLAVVKLMNSDAPEYSPEEISVTTWFRRCSYRAGCYSNGLGTLQESNWIKKDVTTGAPIYIDKTGQPCGDTYTTLTANGVPTGGKYLWSTGDTTAILPILNSTLNGVAKTYTVTYTLAGAACVTTGSIVVNAPICFAITEGGSISLGQTICNVTTYDPPKIQSIGRPSGGGGEITYFWIYTTKDPEDPNSGYSAGLDNIIIDNSNSDCYDPPVITKTTWFRRCALGKGCCSADPGESNWTKFELKSNCCDQVTDAGEISEEEERCLTSYKPTGIVSKRDASGGSGAIEYVWLTTSLYDADGDPRNFTMIDGAIAASYEPPVIAKTTWYRRCARRAGCESYEEVVWVKKAVVKNVTDAGEISGTEAVCEPRFTPKPLKNVRLASGGSGLVEYIWVKSDENNAAGSPIYAEILGAFDTTYQASLLTKSTFFRRCARTKSTASLAFQCPYKETTPIGKTIKPEVVFENVPPNMSLSCETPYAISLAPTIKGSLTTPSLTMSESMTPGNCPDNYTVKRTWTSSNNCGTPISAVQLIVKEDIKKPVFTTAVANISVACGTNPAVPTQLAKDNCDPTVQISFAEKLIAATATENAKVLRTWTASDNCSNTAQLSQTIHFLANPNFKANSNAPLCSNLSLKLNATGCNSCTYSWSGPNGFTSVSKNPVLTNTNPTLSGTYNLKMTDALGCFANIPLAVTVNPNPVAVISSNAPLCASEKLTLNASPATTYNWTGPNFTSTVASPVVNNVTSVNNGTYKLTVTDSKGCKGTTSALITVKPQANYTITAAFGTVLCEGKTINLSTNTTLNTVWTGPNDYTIANKTMNRTNATASMSGDYKAVVTSTNGCKSSKTMSVVVKPCVAGLSVQHQNANIENELFGLDGTTTIEDETATEQLINLYPNPADDKLFVRINGTDSNNSALKIYSNSGQLMLEQTVENISNEATIQLDISVLPSGFYILTFGKEKLKFIRNW